jgi:hypothetical protein
LIDLCLLRTVDLRAVFALGTGDLWASDRILILRAIEVLRAFIIRRALDLFVNAHHLFRRRWRWKRVSLASFSFTGRRKRLSTVFSGAIDILHFRGLTRPRELEATEVTWTVGVGLTGRPSLFIRETLALADELFAPLIAHIIDFTDHRGFKILTSLAFITVGVALTSISLLDWTTDTRDGDLITRTDLVAHIIDLTGEL